MPSVWTEPARHLDSNQASQRSSSFHQLLRKKCLKIYMMLEKTSETANGSITLSELSHSVLSLMVRDQTVELMADPDFNLSEQQVEMN